MPSLMLLLIIWPMPHRLTFCLYYLPSSSLFYFISFEPRELLRRMVSSAILIIGYGINLPATSISACRWFYYVGYVLTCSSASYVIVAAIDRILITSSNARTRQRSTRRNILTWIISLTIVWMLFHIHALIYMRILHYGPGFIVCSYQPGTYTTFITYCRLLTNGTIPPLLMIFFGLWTIRNIRKISRATHPADAMNQANAGSNSSRAVQSKDHQFIRMLLVDIVFYVVSVSTSTIFLIYQQIIQYQIKTIEQVTYEGYVASIGYFLVYLAPSVSRYANLIVSKNFRIEFKRIFSTMLRRLSGQIH